MATPSATVNGLPVTSNGTLLALTRGDTATLTATISNLSSAGLTGASLTFTAKYALSDADASAVIQKLNAAWVVTQVGNATTPGVASLTFVPADTSGLPGYTVLLNWDMQLKDGTGAVYTIASGFLRVVADATISTT